MIFATIMVGIFTRYESAVEKIHVDMNELNMAAWVGFLLCIFIVVCYRQMIK